MSIHDERTERVFVTNALLDEGTLDDAAIGTADVARFLTSPDFELTDQQTRRLFSDPKVSATYRRLKSLLRGVALPVVAAASSGDVTERWFDGGHLRVVASSNGVHVYVTVIFDDAAHAATEPSILLLETATGEVARLAVPAADENGRIFVILDIGEARDAAVVAALRDPRTIGLFLTLDRGV